jgi:G:T-mismatch repair DNA endonuclease (very short patch repair protein)
MRRQILLPLLLWLALAETIVAQEKSDNPLKDDPETVLVTFHAKAGKEDELAKVLTKAGLAYRKLEMLLPLPRLVVRGADGADRAFFVEVMTWKDHNTPDHAPEEVKKIWSEMQALCEKRDGRPGIDIQEVHLIQP